jgi:hypothetical protein
MRLEQKLLALRGKACRTAKESYLLRGFVPSPLIDIIKATTSIKAFLKYNPDQPRVPAGSPDGGEWAPGGGRDKNPDTGLRKAPNKTIEKRAKAIYGETAGLTPQLKNPKSSPYNRSNWDADSAVQLETARTYIGIVSDRNPNVNYAAPANANNSIQAQTWSDAVDAAINGNNSSQLNQNVTNFFLRQEGIGRQTPQGWGNLERHLSLGPFNNVGGGDVPKGPNTYIDFYGK